VALMISILLGWSQGENLGAITHFANGVVEAFAGVCATDKNVWKKLEKEQGKEVIDALVSDASTLEEKKNDLRNELVRAPVISSVTDLEGKIGRLKDLTRAIRDKLDRFAIEVDAAAAGVGAPLRAEVRKAETNKISELEDVRQKWAKGNRREAINQLDLALRDLQTLRAGLECFKQSIKDGKEKCDPRTLKKE
jgi:hypothetical protein